MMFPSLANPADGRMYDKHAPLEDFGKEWDFSVTWKWEGKGLMKEYRCQGISFFGDLNAQ